MPSASKKQHNFMAAIAHNPAFAKKVGVPQSVGKDFNAADKGRKFKEGGAMKENMKMDKSQDKAMIKKAFKQHDAQEHKGGKGTKLALKKGGMPLGMKDKVGRAMPAPTADMMSRAVPRRPMASEAASPMMKKGGMTKMAKGGGVESKGKTKGTMVTMKRGGKTC
jgi:hypothetical protein